MNKENELINLREIRDSIEFTDFLKKYEHIPKFKDMSLEAKLLYYAKFREHGSKAFKDITYERQVVPIEEFLSSPDYASNIGRKVLSKWRKELLEFFNPNKNYNEFIMTGAIRTGKSYISRIAQIYNLYKVLCLRDPQTSFNLSPESSLWGMFISTSQKKAFEVGLGPFINMLRQCPIFKEVRNIQQLETYKGDKLPFFASSDWCVYFKKNIEFHVGSNIDEIAGNNVFSFGFDEAELAGGVYKVLNIYTELRQRVEQTFPIRNLTYMSIISSSGLQNGIISSYINKLQPEDMDYIRICKYSKWELDETKDPYKDGHFFVLRGNQNYPSEILADDVGLDFELHPEKLYPNTKVIKIPIKLHQHFRLNLVKSLRDIAGEPTITDDLPFPDVTCIEDPNLPRIVTVNCSINDTKGKLFTQMPLDLFVKDFEGRYVFKRAPKVTRYGHTDLSLLSTSETAITIVHKELNLVGEEIIVADLIINILTRDRIRIAAVEDLIIDLARHGMRFHKFTFDKFQSEGSVQRLTEARIARHVEVRSMLDAGPVREFSSLIAEERFKCGLGPLDNPDKFKKQLMNVSIDSEKNKVRKDKEQSVKDIYESVVGAACNALENTRDRPTTVYQEEKKSIIFRNNESIKDIVDGMLNESYNTLSREEKIQMELTNLGFIIVK